MYTTPTPVIVAGATLTPAVGSVIDAGGPVAAGAEAAAPILIGPGIDAGTAAAIDTGAVSDGGAGAVELVEVLGVKFSRGDNPLVDAVHGAATGTLPMTGVNLLFLVLSAITLVLMGLVIVRIGRNLAATA